MELVRIENSDRESNFLGDNSYRLGQIGVVGYENGNLKAI